MKIAYAGFDLMLPAMQELCENQEVIRLFTCAVDDDFETNSGVIALAKRYGIPYTTSRITPEDVEKLIQDGCELLISAGYYYRIPMDGCLPMVNIHPSLLPYGRGAWPMPLAILDELLESGVTIHKTVEDYDAGDILLQERFALDTDETLDSFMRKVNGFLPAMLDKLCAEFDALWQNAKPQGKGVYLPEPDPEDYVLTPESPADYADRVLRAFCGFMVFYEAAGQRFVIRRGRVICGDNSDREFPVRGGYIKILQN